MVSVCQWSGRLVFNPRPCHTKEMLFDAYLLNTQHYKGMWIKPEEEVAPFLTPSCSSFWKGSLCVALNYSQLTYSYYSIPSTMIASLSRKIKISLVLGILTLEWHQLISPKGRWVRVVWHFYDSGKFSFFTHANVHGALIKLTMSHTILVVVKYSLLKQQLFSIFLNIND